MRTEARRRSRPDDKMLDGLFDALSRCLTPSVARKIVGVRAAPELQARIDELAVKCNEGRLTVEEQAQYESFVRAIHFVTILQSRARRLLARTQAS